MCMYGARLSAECSEAGLAQREWPCLLVTQNTLEEVLPVCYLSQICGVNTKFNSHVGTFWYGMKKKSFTVNSKSTYDK